MSRPDGAWVPDGRARSIRADCEASLDALDGLAIDLYLLHAPDPRTPWRTSVRALAKLVDEGLVARVGVANVNRDQLDEALELAPIAAVQVALSPFDDRALRGGVVDRCIDGGLAAHRALSARWAAACDESRPPRAARRDRGRPRRFGRGSRARLAPRPRAERGRDSRARGDPRPPAPLRGRPRSGSRSGSASACARGSVGVRTQKAVAPARYVRRRRRRDGRPRSRQVAARRGVRRAWLRPAEPRRARRLAPRARRRSRERPRVRRTPESFSTTRT